MKILGKEIKMVMTPIILVGAIIVFTAIGLVSAKFLGPDNVIEQEMETVVEEEVETVFHADKGSLKSEVDLIFPHKKIAKDK